MSENEFESGLVLVAEGHSRLAALDPNHNLLRYGAVIEGEGFIYEEAQFGEAVKRFAKEGELPKGERAGTYMLARHLQRSLTSS